MEDNNILETGTHEELAERNGKVRCFVYEPVCVGKYTDRTMRPAGILEVEQVEELTEKTVTENVLNSYKESVK